MSTVEKWRRASSIAHLMVLSKSVGVMLPSANVMFNKIEIKSLNI